MRTVRAPDRERRDDDHAATMRGAIDDIGDAVCQRLRAGLHNEPIFDATEISFDFVCFNLNLCQ